MGTNIPELVFTCCNFCPKKQFIEGIINLEKTIEISELVESIFDFKNEYGYNCMIVSFNMMEWHKNETGNVPDSSLEMFNEIESTVLYFIKLAVDNNLNLDKILNWVTENGETLFFRASFYSESLALELLSRNVDVKTVDNLFITPLFQVS